MDTNTEIWKTIKDFPQYQISNFGNVMSYKNPLKPKLLKGQITKKGYKNYHLRDKNGKSYSKQAHRLVLENFLPCNNMSELDVNHKDENKLNNHLDNLEWLTHKENVNYKTGHTRAAQSQQDTILCIETGIIYNSLKEAAEQCKLNYYNLSTASHNPNKTCGGYHWINLTNKKQKTRIS